MKLVNRIFFSVFGLIIFSTLASTILGAVLISDAVRSEASSRVELGLKEARSELDDSLVGLSFSAQAYAGGLEEVLLKTAEPDIVRIFPAALPPLLSRYGLVAGKAQRGTIRFSTGDMRELGYTPEDPHFQAVCPGGEFLCLFAL